MKFPEFWAEWKAPKSLADYKVKVREKIRSEHHVHGRTYATGTQIPSPALWFLVLPGQNCSQGWGNLGSPNHKPRGGNEKISKPVKKGGNFKHIIECCANAVS